MLGSFIFTSVLYGQNTPDKKIDKSMLCVGEYQTKNEAKKQLKILGDEVKTLEDWVKRAKMVREGIFKGAELLPQPEKGWVNPIYRNKRNYDGYSVLNIAFQSVEGVFVTGSLYLPEKKNSKVPAIVSLHEHKYGNENTGRFSEDNQKRCATLAKMGAVVLSFDMVGYGEMKEAGWLHDHPKTLKLQLWNGIRAIDLLTELHELRGDEYQGLEIDTNRIGVIGDGIQTILLAAIDERVKISVPIGNVSSQYFGNCICESGMPVHKSENHQTNNAEIAALTAPNPMLIISDSKDFSKNVPDVELPYIVSRYKLFNKTENIKNKHFVNGSPYSKREVMYSFIAHHLKLDPAGVINNKGVYDESKVVIEEEYMMHVFNSMYPLPLTIVRDNDQAFNFDLTKSPVKYITTDIENGSHMNWEKGSDGVIYIDLTYQNQRDNFNRASIHWHFLMEAEKGANITLIIRNFKSIYNGKSHYQLNNEKCCVVSNDGKKWKHPKVEVIDNDRLKVTVNMETDSIYVASVEPYRLSDLTKFMDKIKGNARVKISKIGESVEGRDMHIIQIGNENAKNGVFIRARVHPWEPGGNWVVEGLADELLKETVEAENYLKDYCVYILPMANIDGVARGTVRYNMRGFDLNRRLSATSDPSIAKENNVMEQWFSEMLKKGKLPKLAMDIHNDQFGPLIFAAPLNDYEGYIKRMKVFEKLMRENTWFREEALYSSKPSYFNMSDQFGFDWMVLELSANWIEGLQKKPLSDDWKLLGGQLCTVFFNYFNSIKNVSNE